MNDGIPIGGGIIGGTVIYEPLEDGSFVVCDVASGKRSIVDVTPATEKTPTSPPFPASLCIGGKYLPFEGEPARPFWFAPKRGVVKDWIDGKVKSPSSQTIFKLLKRCFEVFGDFEDAYSVVVLTLFAVQTHIKPILNSLFQLPLSGPYGSGKSNELSALGEVCYHPFMEANTSPAARVHALKQIAPSYFSDELDKMTFNSKGEEDNIATVILRAGYRRGFNYVRWDADRNTWLSIPIFFPLAYTFSSDVEQALRQRSIAEISVSKSKDTRVPVINTVRSGWTQGVAQALFFWRLEFLETAIKNGALAGVVTPGKEVEQNVKDLLELDPSVLRERVYTELVRNFSTREKYVLKMVFGREAELCYVALTIEKALGVDVVQELAVALNRQLEAISSEPDARFVEFRRLIMAEVRGHAIVAMKGKFDPGKETKAEAIGDVFAKAYFDESGSNSVEIVVSGVLESLRSFIKLHSLNPKMGPKTLGTWYKRLGFVVGRNKFHRATGEYLAVDSKTWEKMLESTKGGEIDLKALPKAEPIEPIEAITQSPEGVPMPMAPTGESSIGSIGSIASGEASP